MRIRVRSLASLSGLRIWSCCELWCSCRFGSDLVLLWLWRKPPATALIRLLVEEPPHATGTTLKRKKTKNKHKRLEMADEEIRRYLSQEIKGTWSSLLFTNPIRPSFKRECSDALSQALLMGMQIRTVSTFGLSIGNFYQNP